jgi:membrane protein
LRGNRIGQKAEERRLTTGAQIANLPYKGQSANQAASGARSEVFGFFMDAAQSTSDLKNRGLWSLFQEAASLWSAHNAPRLGASLAYYVVLSLAPLVLLCVALCGRIFGEDAVRGQVYWEIKDVTGGPAAAVVQTLLREANKPGTGVWATVVGTVILLFGASGVFVELRDILNLIWDAPPANSSYWAILRYRLFSFAVVCATGLLVMVSLVFSTIVQAAGTYASRYVTFPSSVVEATNSLVGFVILSVLFTLIYKFIPEVSIAWRDVLPGAVMTAALFIVGKFALALYLGKAGVGSPYGAAGSLVVLLVWLYYSLQIFLYGAEFTHVFARRARANANERATSSWKVHEENRTIHL